MEDVIEQKPITADPKRSASNIVRRIAARFSRLWAHQADYEQVNQRIEETRLKYELFRMRL